MGTRKVNEDEKAQEICRILTEWNPLGTRAADVSDLNDYETEAYDILWAMDLHSDSVKKVVATVLQQAFHIELDDSSLEHYRRKIASALGDQVKHCVR